MAGHSCSKNGVAPLAYVPAIHHVVFAVSRCVKTWMPGTRPGMTSWGLDHRALYLPRPMKLP